MTGAAVRRVGLKGFEGSGLYLSTCASFPSIQSFADCAGAVEREKSLDQSRQGSECSESLHPLTSRGDFRIKIRMEIDVLSSRDIDGNGNDGILSEYD